MNQTQAHKRPPAVAGMFYPAQPGELRNTVVQMLEQSHCRSDTPPKALIVPHAGLVYSGPIAASAYACLAPLRDQVKKVVLFGPDHKVGFRGMAVPEWDTFTTPLGDIPLDEENIRKLEELPEVVRSNLAHAYEHSLEVQLPFLQTVLGDFELTPVVVSSATPHAVARALKEIWGGPETLILISSDLSHYHPYDEARVLDSATTFAIEHLDDRPLESEKACGYIPVSGLLQVAREKGLHEETLDVRNSGDTAGSRDQVVGYGAYAFA